MFCPVCKAEYRTGFTHCSDCDVDLVERLSPDKVQESKMNFDPGDYVEVLRTHDQFDISFIKSVLDDNEISYFINNENMMYANAVLFISKKDITRAEEILKNIKLNFGRLIG